MKEHFLSFKRFIISCFSKTRIQMNRAQMHMFITTCFCIIPSLGKPKKVTTCKMCQHLL